jgi:hypothetical protein
MLIIEQIRIEGWEWLGMEQGGLGMRQGVSRGCGREAGRV